MPLLPVLSVLFAGTGSDSSASTVALLSNVPEASMVAVTVMVVSAPEASDGIVHGSAAQPPPLTLVMVAFIPAKEASRPSSPVADERTATTASGPSR